MLVSCYTAFKAGLEFTAVSARASNSLALLHSFSLPEREREGSHWSANFLVTGMTRLRKNPGASGIPTRDPPLSRRRFCRQHPKRRTVTRVRYRSGHMWHFLKLVARGFLRVLRFPPLLPRFNWSANLKKKSSNKCDFNSVKLHS